MKQLLASLFLATTLHAAPSGLDSIVELIGQIDDPAFQADILKGMHDGLAGQKNIPPPKGWAEVARKLMRSILQFPFSH